MSCARTVKNLDSRPAICPVKMPQAAQDAPKETKYFVAGSSLTRVPIPMSSSQNAALNAQQPPPPKTFDWREQKGLKNQFLVNKINQGGCGSCWAVAIATALGDRYAIALNKRGFSLRKGITGSPIEMLSCSCEGRFGLGSNQICLGGNVQMAANYIQSNLKISTNACFPYPQKAMATANPSSTTISWEQNNTGDGDLGCMKNVTGCEKGKECGESSIKLSVKPGSVATWPKTNGIDVLKNEIATNGPVTTSYAVPTDFIEWWQSSKKTDVYKGNFSSPPSGHAVVIIGYTKDAWIVRNSWGPTHDGDWHFLSSFDNDIGIGLNGSHKEFPGGAVSFEAVIDDDVINAMKENKYIGDGGTIDDPGGGGGGGGGASGILKIIKKIFAAIGLGGGVKISGLSGSSDDEMEPNKGKAFSSTVNMVLSLLILAALIFLILMVIKKGKK